MQQTQFNYAPGVLRIYNNMHVPVLLLLLQLERVRQEQGDAAAERCGAGFYYSESATTRHIILALPKTGDITGLLLLYRV